MQYSTINRGLALFILVAAGGPRYGLEILFPYNEADSSYWIRLKDACAENGVGKTAQELIGGELGIDVKWTAAIAGKLLTTEDG